MLEFLTLHLYAYLQIQFVHKESTPLHSIFSLSFIRQCLAAGRVDQVDRVDAEWTNHSVLFAREMAFPAFPFCRRIDRGKKNSAFARLTFQVKLTFITFLQ